MASLPARTFVDARLRCEHKHVVEPHCPHPWSQLSEMAVARETVSDHSVQPSPWQCSAPWVAPTDRHSRTRSESQRAAARGTWFPGKWFHSATGKKTPGGAGTHTGHTGHTGARYRYTGSRSRSFAIKLPVQRHRGEPGHTRDTQAHTRTVTEDTDEPHNHPNPSTTHPHYHATAETAANSTAARTANQQ